MGFPTTCRVCGVDIWMAKSKNGQWRPLDFPENSPFRSWRRHWCIGRDDNTYEEAAY